MKLIINISGGNVAGILSTDKNVEVLVLDADADGEELICEEKVTEFMSDGEFNPISFKKYFYK